MDSSWVADFLGGTESSGAEHDGPEFRRQRSQYGAGRRTLFHTQDCNRKAAAEEDTNSSLPQIPALLGGVGISTASLSELAKSNYLRGGVNVGATYDDNPLLASTGQLSNTSETIFPNIKFDESTSRTRWTLGYAGGLTINQKITNQNQGSHNVVFDSQFRLSPHVNLRVAENFFRPRDCLTRGMAPESSPARAGRTRA